MKRIAILGIVALLAACRSDSNGIAPIPVPPSDTLPSDTLPSDTSSGTFSGTWSGDGYYPNSTDTHHDVFVARQRGIAVTGLFTRSSSSDGTDGPYVSTFTGRSTPPTLNLVLEGGVHAVTYAGTYITSDSLAGTFTVDSTTVALSLKKN